MSFCLVSYTDVTVPTVCVTEGAMEQLNGNLRCRSMPNAGKAWGFRGVRRRGDEGDEFWLDRGWREGQAGQINGPVEAVRYTSLTR